jgi:hypothetical protein
MFYFSSGLQCTQPGSFRVVSSRTLVATSPLDFLHSIPLSFSFSSITFFFPLIVWYFSRSSTFNVFLQHFKLASMSVHNLCIKILILSHNVGVNFHNPIQHLSVRFMYLHPYGCLIKLAHCFPLTYPLCA